MGGLANLTSWLEHNALTVVLLAIGVLILTRVHTKDHKGALTSVAIVLIGLAVVGLAVGGNALNVGNWLVSLFTG